MKHFHTTELELCGEIRFATLTYSVDEDEITLRAVVMQRCVTCHYTHLGEYEPREEMVTVDVFGLLTPAQIESLEVEIAESLIEEVA